MSSMTIDEKMRDHCLRLYHFCLHKAEKYHKSDSLWERERAKSYAEQAAHWLYEYQGWGGNNGGE